jgi:hypothetical protein
MKYWVLKLCRCDQACKSEQAKTNAAHTPDLYVHAVCLPHFCVVCRGRVIRTEAGNCRETYQFRMFIETSDYW